MRLINTDDLTLVTDWTDDVPHSYYEQWDVDEAPTVEAIPIEWIREYAFRRNVENPFRGTMNVVNEMIEKWREENDTNRI